MGQFTPLQLSLQPFSSPFKLDLKDRAITNQIKRELEQKQGGVAAVTLLPNKSNATANANLLAGNTNCSFKATLCNFDHNPLLQKTKLNNTR